MLRLPPTHIGLEDIVLADVDNMTARYRTIEAARALNAALDSPSLASEATTHLNHSSSNPPLARRVLGSPTHLDDFPPPPTDSNNNPITLAPPPPQEPYTHLPYGPAREAILLSNLHLSHLHVTTALANAHAALDNDTLSDSPPASHTALHSEIASLNRTLEIYSWRDDVIAQHAAEEGKSDEYRGWLYSATDLHSSTVTKYTDLRRQPLLGLAAVKPAESAFEPGIKFKKQAPVHRVLGIEGQRVTAGGVFTVQAGMWRWFWGGRGRWSLVLGM